MKNGTALWREAHFPLKISDVQTWHAAVAPSTFESQNVHETVWLVHILEDSIRQKWYRTVARSTFSSQNVHEAVLLARTLEDRIWINCTPLWREAHL